MRAAAKRSKDGPQARRLLALAAIYDGATRTEAAKIGGVGLQVVRDWVIKFNAHGPDGLIDGKAPGQPPRLNDAHRAALAAIIDFSSPAASVALAGLAAQARIADVIGTTGLTDEDLDKIDAAARHAPIVRSGNMSIGVNLLAALTRRAASALGKDFDIEIVEMHHRMKVDSPSGTALLLGEAAADERCR